MQNERVSIVIEHIKNNNTLINSISVDNYDENSSFKGGEYENSALAFEHDSSYTNNIYNGYLSTSISSNSVNNQGNYDCSWQANIEGTTITTFIIVFDKYLNEFATEIEINGIIYKNDSTEFVYNNTTQLNKLQIKFLSWNKESSNIKFLSLLTSISTRYDRITGLKSFAITSKDKDSVQPQYGIVSQSGSISILDKNNRLFNLARMGLLGESNVDIYIGEFRIGKFSTKTEWSFDNNSKVYSVELDDGMTKLQKIKQSESIGNQNYTALEMYSDLKRITPLSFSGLDSLLVKHLQSIKINEDCFKENDYLWYVWEEFCLGTNTRLTMNFQGEAQLRR